MKWRVPLSDLDFGEEEIKAVERVVRSKWLTMGEVTNEFERQFCHHLKIKHAFAVSSGTAALHIAGTALGLGAGDEVIVPSLIFAGTVNSILYTGATPVFADVTSEDDLNISCRGISENITENTKAVIVFHYGGHVCDMTRICQIAKDHNLHIIEDAAHASGARLEDRKAGTFGDIGCFSFFSNKNLVCGEGGMVVTNDDGLAGKMSALRSHGMSSPTWDRHQGHAFSYDITMLGYNYRIDEIRSALGIEQLKKLDRNNQRRAKLVKLYRARLSEVSEVSIPFENASEESSHHIFSILLSQSISRVDFMNALKEQGIQSSIHYPRVTEFSYYKSRFGGTRGLTKTESVCARVVTLPLYPTMSVEQMEYVCEAVKGFFDN